jgi:hypothetical protein
MVGGPFDRHRWKEVMREHGSLLPGGLLSIGMLLS